MKNRVPLAVSCAISAILISSCVSTAKSIPPPAGAMAIGGKGAIKATSITDGLTTIAYKGKSYSPSSGQNKFICEVGVTVENQGETAIDKPDLKAMEMALIDAAGKVSFAAWTKPFDVSSVDFSSLGLDAAKNPKKEQLEPGSDFSDKVFFVHDAAATPVSLVVNRAEWVMLIGEGDARSATVIKALERAKSVEMAATMAMILPYETISEFMKANEISVNDVDKRGLTLLYAGLLANNDSVIEGAIKDGADIHAPASYSYWGGIEPIHVALLQNNKKAIKALMDAGADIRVDPADGDEPSVVAARNDNIEALKTAREFGVDVKSLMIPMAWSPSVPIMDFAKKKGHEKLLEYLESIE